MGRVQFWFHWEICKYINYQVCSHNNNLVVCLQFYTTNVFMFGHKLVLLHTLHIHFKFWLLYFISQVGLVAFCEKIINSLPLSA